MSLIKSARYRPSKRRCPEEDLARPRGEGYIDLQRAAERIREIDPYGQISYDLCQDVLCQTEE